MSKLKFIVPTGKYMIKGANASVWQLKMAGKQALYLHTNKACLLGTVFIIV